MRTCSHLYARFTLTCCFEQQLLTDIVPVVELVGATGDAFAEEARLFEDMDLVHIDTNASCVVDSAYLVGQVLCTMVAVLAVVQNNLVQVSLCWLLEED